MLALNNLSLLEALMHDFEKNQQLFAQSKVAVKGPQKNTEFPVDLGMKGKSSPIYLKLIIEAIKNLRCIKKLVNDLYVMFTKADIRVKEDIYLGVEKIKNNLDLSSKDGNPFFWGRIVDRFNYKFRFIFLEFEKKLKNELYEAHVDYSQKELEEMASKYKDFPKEILENHSSEKYSERYL